MLKQILYFEIYHGLQLIGIILFYPILILIAAINKILKLLRKYVVGSKSIRGQVAVVTGGARGLGRDIAQELAHKGCHIAIVDVQEELALETAKYLTDTYDIKCKAYKIDITDYEQLEQLRDCITSDLGPPTILINNAAILLGTSLTNLSPSEAKQMIEVNFTAMYYIQHIFVPKLKQLNQGYIVNICSASALLTTPLFNVYAATKAAVRSLSSSLRMEFILERKNITVTTVMPTFLKTNKNVEKIHNLTEVGYVLPTMTGEVCAKYAINGMLNGSREITVPSTLIYIYKLLESLPVFIVELFASLIIAAKYKTIINSRKIAEVLNKQN